MAIPTFDVDMSIIAKLGDYPGADDGLTPEAFRERFDLAGKLIQEYINTVLLPNINMTSDVDALVAGVQKRLELVFSVEQAKFFVKVFELTDFVLNSGSRFNAVKISDTSVNVYGGEALMQGHLVTLETDEPISIAVTAGTYGTYRNDLICLRFARDEEGTETVSVVHIEGAISLNGGVDPAYQQGNMNVLAAVTRDFPLYRIRVDNITSTLEPLFESSNSISNMIAEDAADKVIEKLSVWEGGSY